MFNMFVGTGRDLSVHVNSTGRDLSVHVNSTGRDLSVLCLICFLDIFSSA